MQTGPSRSRADAARSCSCPAALAVLAASLLGTLAVVITGALIGMTLLWRQSVANEKEAQHQAQLARENEAHAKNQKALAQQRQTEAETQKSRALAEADKATKVSGFLVGLFEASDPFGLGVGAHYIPRSTGETLTANQILDRGAEKIAHEKDMPPLTRAMMLDRIGSVYRSVGQMERAEPMIRESPALKRSRIGRICLSAKSAKPLLYCGGFEPSINA